MIVKRENEGQGKRKKKKRKKYGEMLEFDYEKNYFFEEQNAHPLAVSVYNTQIQGAQRGSGGRDGK